MAKLVFGMNQSLDSLKSVGPNARLVGDDLEGAIRALKAEREGEIEVAGHLRISFRRSD